MPFSRSSWSRVALTHFVLCTFLGVLLLDLSEDAIRRLMGSPGLDEIVLGSLVAGCNVALATWLLHRFWFRRLRRRYFGGGTDPRKEWQGTLVGFLCGAMSPLYLLEPILLQVLSLVFLLLIFTYASAFLRRVGTILRPGNHPRPEDIANLAFAYATLLACFTILNVAIAYLARLPDGTTAAFRGFENMADPLTDSFYFTVVMMTTLGFGDISPATPGAKLAVALQVVIAYVLFALMVGTITRGILPHDKNEETPQGDDTESR